MGIISYIKEEIQVIRERDPAIKSNMEVLLYPTRERGSGRGCSLTTEAA